MYPYLYSYPSRSPHCITHKLFTHYPLLNQPAQLPSATFPPIYLIIILHSTLHPLHVLYLPFHPSSTGIHLNHLIYHGTILHSLQPNPFTSLSIQHSLNPYIHSEITFIHSNHSSSQPLILPSRGRSERQTLRSLSRVPGSGSKPSWPSPRGLHTPGRRSSSPDLHAALTR